jgi:hypothetical protein
MKKIFSDYLDQKMSVNTTFIGENVTEPPFLEGNQKLIIKNNKNRMKIPVIPGLK